MATFIIQSFGGVGDLRALNGTEGTPTGTEVTYTNPVNAPGVVLTLTGTGIIGTPSATWNITGISATLNGSPAWTLTGLTGVDGTPTSGVFDTQSIFQAVAFHSTFNLLFGHASTLIGSPVASSTWLFGGDGNDVLIARAGNVLMDGGGGGFDTLVGASRGHDFFKFDSRLDGSFDTIRAYSPARDTIELDRGTFDHIHHLGVLTAAEFHSGLGAPSKTGADIVYNHGNGRLYYDDNGSHLGGLHLFAIVANHAALTAAEFLVIA
jgi:hypothetical protein